MANKIEAHQHVLENGMIIQHIHVQEEKGEEDAEDGKHKMGQHTHTHQNTKAVLNRLSKVIGHLEAIKRMVENERDCSDVLIQLAAVKSAINSTGKVILKDHIEHCIVDAIRQQDMEALEELNNAIDRFLK